MVLSAPVVYPRDHVADWGLWLATHAQHHKRVPYTWCLPRNTKKSQTQNQRCNFYWTHTAFCTIVKRKKLLTIRSQGLLVHPLRETRGLPFPKAWRNSLRRTLASSKSARAAVLYMLGMMIGDTGIEICSWVLMGIMRSSTGSVVTLSDHSKLDKEGSRARVTVRIGWLIGFFSGGSVNIRPQWISRIPGARPHGALH